VDKFVRVVLFLGEVWEHGDTGLNRVGFAFEGAGARVCRKSFHDFDVVVSGFGLIYTSAFETEVEIYIILLQEII